MYSVIIYLLKVRWRLKAELFYFTGCEKIGEKGIGGGIIGSTITITAMIGGMIGVVKGRRNRLPETSFSGATEEDYVTNDETTEAVRIEDELDIDLYTDPGTNNDALNDDLDDGDPDGADEQNLLAIEHDDDQEARFQLGNNDRQLLIVLWEM